MRLQTLKSVWLVMHNEWHSTITRPMFWYATLMTPIMLFGLFLLFQWVLGEDSREALLKEENVKSWEFFLEQELYGSRDGRVDILNYAVLDSTDELAADIREEILKNDWYLFLLKAFELNDDEFVSLRQSLGKGEAFITSEIETLRQRNDEIPIEQLVSQLVGFLPPSDKLSSVDIPGFRTRLANWWEVNLEAIKEVVPAISSNFFNDITNVDVQEDDVNLMLASKEIVGYFVIPEDFGAEGAEAEFVARVDTPRSQFLDLVNWYRSVGSDVLQKQQYEEIGVDPQTRQLLLLRADFETNDVVVEDSDSKIIPKSFYQFIYVALPLLLYFVFLGTSMRLVAIIVDEKTSKLADGLLANMSPVTLLDGKLWGTALLSLTVAAIWVVFIPIFVVVTGRWHSNVDPTILSYLFRPVVVLNFFLFLLLVYALYGYFIVAFTSRFSRLNNAMSAALYFQFGVLFLFVMPTVIVPFIPFKGLQDVLSFFR
ncbi:MAG: ABC transporter permease [Gammaproteobacteria bacterium]|nr:ABC transporter permease [Gammaproteobacteria bacterium]MYF37653.1 ABC transporter permease [Gammaproteobacteria bacterium]